MSLNLKKYILWTQGSNLIYYTEYYNVEKFVNLNFNVNLLTEFFVISANADPRLQKVSFHGFSEKVDEKNQNFKRLNFERYSLKKRNNQEGFFKLKPSGLYVSSVWNQCQSGEIIVSISKDTIYNALISEDNYGKIMVDLGFSSTFVYKNIVNFLNDWQNLGQNFDLKYIVTINKEIEVNNSEIIKFD